MTIRNLITDVAGVRVGHSHDQRLASGVTAILFDAPTTAGCFVPGGAPGGRDTELLAPEMTVSTVDGFVLSGGSSFGLDAVTGAQSWLRERGRGLAVRDARIPIVPGAILFDLLSGGDKDWGRHPPYRDLAYAACEGAGADFCLGSVGAGLGATTFDLKGGIGSASAALPGGGRVGALVAVNSLGSAVIGGGPHFWAAPWEVDGEFGALGSPSRVDTAELAPRWKGSGHAQPGTTLAVVATDARLTPSAARRLAIMASAGLARGLSLVFAPMDGDTIFVAGTGAAGLTEPTLGELTMIGSVAAACLARSIARAVYEAAPLKCSPLVPSWTSRFDSVL